MRRMLLVFLLLAPLTVASCGEPSVDDRLAAFLTAWQKADFAGIDLLTPQGRALDAAAARQLLTDVEGELTTRRPKLTKHGKANLRGADADVRVGVAWPLPDGRTWTYDTRVNARKTGDDWQIYLGAETVHPGLHDGQHLTLRQSTAPRGTVLAADGTPIVSEIPVVYVGLEPRFVDDVPAVIQHLDLVFRSVRVDVDVSGLPAKLQAAKPDAFVDVVTLRQTDYAEIETDLRNTHGITTRTGKLSLPLTRTFGRALLGVSGPATKELIDASAGALKAGDTTGLTGLQRRYDTLLRGLPGLSVIAAPAETGADPLFTTPPAPGGQLRTTIDVKIQQAAETALSATPKQSALVALRISDGTVLAVANGPDAAGYNLAMLGELPNPPLGTDPAAVGLGLPWQLGADVFTGRTTGTGVVASPLAYAAAAAAVSRGHWLQPTLIRTPPPASPAPASPAAPAVKGPLTTTTVTTGTRGDVAYCLYVEGTTPAATTSLTNTFLSALPA